MRLAAGELDHMQAEPRALGAQPRLRATLAPSALAGDHFGDHQAGAEARASRRNGASVMPDMGASRTRFVRPSQVEVR